jgi:hypothetical protein
MQLSKLLRDQSHYFEGHPLRPDRDAARMPAGSVLINRPRSRLGTRDVALLGPLSWAASPSETRILRLLTFRTTSCDYR